MDSLELWKWISSFLVIILGWLLGWILGRKGSWETEKGTVLLRITQLEELNKLRVEHPEYHPLANWLNAQIGKSDGRIMRLEGKVDDLQEENKHERE